MKHLYLLFLALFAIQISHTQIVTIPDANFKNALLNHNPVIDTNNDGEIQVGEAEAVINLNISNQNISVLTGIEFFVNLTSLRCSQNELTQLDVTTN